MESACRRDAVSPAGAMGFAQFMPGTWRDVAARLALPAHANPFDDIAVEAGAFYMRRKRDHFRPRWAGVARTPSDRHRLALAAYNCGARCVDRAQARCANAPLFEDIAPCLPAETRAYAPKVARRAREIITAHEKTPERR